MSLSNRKSHIALWLTAALMAACNTTITTPEQELPGTPVEPKLPADQQADQTELLKKIEDSANMTPAEFATLYQVPFSPSLLPYDPSQAAMLDLVQGSAMALTSAEKAALAKNGFVISEEKRFPTFGYGYASLYAMDLPLYVSADSILYAVHRSYDDMLKAVEENQLIAELTSLLTDMRAALSKDGAASSVPEVRADVDVYLAVAQSLLSGAAAGPVAGGSAADINALIKGAEAHQGEQDINLFGSNRHVDFSQFEPRGHYTDTPELGRYFQAMMWMGRIDFRFLEPDEAGKLMFHRRQVEGAFALGALMNDTSQARWNTIDKTIHAFVGEADYMMVPELKNLLTDLGVTDPGDIANLSDDKVAQTILDGGYGTQRISSHIMINGLGKGTLPLSSSFAFFGQRYVVDSHVFSNVVYDRVQHGKVMRMMPNPLDAAFAAMGNDQAGMLLAPEIQKWGYAPDLHAMRLLVDAHEPAYWTDNLYNLWLGSLRALSPTDDVAAPAKVGLPAVTGTEAWGRRLLNTQLGLWAELRHDTILYAKQSYTGGASCEFPDAYVEPYPQFWDNLAAFATYGQDLVQGLDLSANPWLSQQFNDYFNNLEAVALTLGSMAEHQRSGTPFDAAQMEFINQAVKLQEGCGEPTGVDGWYAKLFLYPESAVTFNPTIADVHTQPTDEVGNTVGYILHAGTGSARMMLVTADTCTGPRAYVGLASSYFEEITKDFQRMTDEEWADKLNAATPPDVPWMTDLVVR